MEIKESLPGMDSETNKLLPAHVGEKFFDLRSHQDSFW
jgi:hypothetical protein